MAERNDVDMLIGCNYAKMLLMLCVMICHSCMFWTESWFTAILPAEPNDVLKCIAYWFGTFQIPAFVLISGYIYSYITKERGGYTDTYGFIKNKAQRLLLPYIVVTICWLIPFCLILRPLSLQGILSKYFLYGGEQLWFLYMLFGVFVIYHLTIKKLNDRLWVEISYVILLFVIGLRTVDYFQIDKSLQYLIYFSIGYRIRIIFGNSCIYKKWNLCNIKVLLPLLIMHFIVFCIAFSFGINCNLFVRLSFSMGGSIIAFFLFVKLGYMLESIHSRFLSTIKHQNFVMYLFHQQIIYICLLLLNGVVPSYLLAVCCFVTSFGVSFLIASGISKTRYLNKILK